MIGAIKRQFIHMVTHVFDNNNLSQEIFAVDTWRAVICSLGHGRKHMLKPGLHISRRDRKQIVTNMYLKLYRYGYNYMETRR